VASLVGRLDGLPLAIELAAARIGLLTPDEMLTRLANSLSVLADSSANLPARQRTMLAAIDWSHDLLSPPERQLLARLSIFRGGFTLEAAEQVCDGDVDDLRTTFDRLASLVDKSLVRSQAIGAETRYSMLETVRDYARERLVESGEYEKLAARHASYFFGLAVEAEPHLVGPDQVNWVERLEREHDNLRAALGSEIGEVAVDQALYAAGAIWRFWQLRGYFIDARQVFERLLGANVGSPRAQAKAHSGAGGSTTGRATMNRWRATTARPDSCTRPSESLFSLPRPSTTRASFPCCSRAMSRPVGTSSNVRLSCIGSQATSLVPPRPRRVLA
jgi:predicted ATPase